MTGINDDLQTPQGVVSVAKEWLDVDVPFNLASTWARRYKKCYAGWTVSAGPLVWLKNRIAESLVFPRSSSQLTVEADSCELHTFFIFITETDEMIATLRLNQTPSESRVSSSRIFREMPIHAIAPVDGVALRVARDHARNV